MKPARASSATPDLPRELLSHIQDLYENADSENTVRAYRSDVRAWLRFAESIGVPPYPVTPDGLAVFIGEMSQQQLAVSTIRRRCCGIGRWHRDKGDDSPTEDRRVRKVIRGLVRKRGVATRRKRALTGAMVRACLDSEMPRLHKTLVALGFVTGLRRSEMVQLRWSDVKWRKTGAVITVHRSKTDQEGRGRIVAIPSGSVTRLLAQERTLDPLRKLVFPVSDKTVSRVVKRVATLCGEDPAEFGAHSLRAGLATAAAEAGVTIGESMAATGHRSYAVAASYVRPVTSLRNRAFAAAAKALETGQ